jgi:hypothetical protein
MRLIFLTLVSLSLLTAKVTNGDILPCLSLVDQFDNKVEIRDDATLIVSFQKSISSEIQAYLDTQPKDFLEENNILYLSDMSAAPTFMIKLFGIPKMKKFNYKVALIYDDVIAKKLQREDNKVTLIRLNHHKIIDIQFVSSNALEKVLKN